MLKVSEYVLEIYHTIGNHNYLTLLMVTNRFLSKTPENEISDMWPISNLHSSKRIVKIKHLLRSRVQFPHLGSNHKNLTSTLLTSRSTLLVSRRELIGWASCRLTGLLSWRSLYRCLVPVSVPPLIIFSGLVFLSKAARSEPHTHMTKESGRQFI